MHLREMDGNLRKLWRAQHSGAEEDQERYVMELQRKLKHAYILVVNTNTWYGRGAAPLLSQQFDKVQAAWNLVTEYGRLPFRMGIDEDAFFTANAHPDLPLMVIDAYNNDQRTITLGGYEFHIDPDNSDDSEFYLTSYDENGGHDIRLVIKDELENPKPGDLAVKRLARIMTDTDPITKDPITTWWEAYGLFSNSPIDPPARAVIEKLNLDLGEHEGGVIDDLEESLAARLDFVLLEAGTGSAMTRYIKTLKKYLEILYPNEYKFTTGGEHHKVTHTSGKTVSISKSPTSMKITDRSVPKDFRTEFGVIVPSYPTEAGVFTDSRLAHEYAGVPYDAPEKKRRVNPKLVKAQELQELQEMPNAIGVCEDRIADIMQELELLYNDVRSSASRDAAIPLQTELEQEKAKHEQLETRYLELMEKYD